jgi:large subunit ribosomal protein L25
VPIHFVGQDQAPGVKTEGGILSHNLTEVDVSCLPADLPEYLEIDVSGLHLHDSLYLSDIKVPEGVEITALLHEGEDQIVATIYAPQMEVEEGLEGEAAEEGVEEAAEAEGEGEAGSEGEESDKD